MSDHEEQTKMNGRTGSGIVEDRPGIGTGSGIVEDRPGVKRIKLSSDEGAFESKAVENQLSDLVECRPPPNIDTTCIEKSVPLEEGRNATGQETGTGSSQLAGSVKQLDEMERVQPAEELSPGLRERKESIDAELKGLLSPMEEEEEGRVVGGKRPSIAEMKAEM